MTDTRVARLERQWKGTCLPEDEAMYLATKLTASYSSKDYERLRELVCEPSFDNQLADNLASIIQEKDRGSVLRYIPQEDVLATARVVDYLEGREWEVGLITNPNYQHGSEIPLELLVIVEDGYLAARVPSSEEVFSGSKGSSLDIVAIGEYPSPRGDEFERSAYCAMLRGINFSYDVQVSNTLVRTFFIEREEYDGFGERTREDYESDFDDEEGEHIEDTEWPGFSLGDIQPAEPVDWDDISDDFN